MKKEFTNEIKQFTQEEKKFLLQLLKNNQASVTVGSILDNTIELPQIVKDIYAKLTVE